MSDQETFASPAEIRHTIGANGTFSLNNVSGDITVRGVDGDEVQVRAVSDHDRGQELPISVRRGDGSLYIDTDEKAGWFSFRHRGGIDFDVTVPRGARVELSGVSSDIAAHGLVGEQTIRSVSGDLVVNGAAGRVSLTSVSGDIQLDGVDTVEASVTSTSGDVEANVPTFESLRIRTVSGDIGLRGGFAASSQHTVESVSGDLNIEALGGVTVDAKRGLDFSKRDSRPTVVGDGSANLRFRSLSGDVHVSGGENGTTTRTPPMAAPIPAEQSAESKEESMEILRALERGEIDVDEASRRLEGAGSRG